MNNLNRAVELLVDLAGATTERERAAIYAELRQQVYGSPVTTPDSAPALVAEMLTELGIPCNIRGYEYIITAVCELLRDPELRRHIVYGLYENVAEKHNSSRVAVEHSIRHAINIGMGRCSVDVIDRYFANSISPVTGAPTNSQFLCCLANEVSRRGVTV